jgi:hypothetical protein
MSTPKQTTEQMAQHVLLIIDERNAIEARLKSNKTDRHEASALKKLIAMHDLFINDSLHSPIKTLRNYLGVACNIVERANDYISNGELVTIQVERADEFNAGRTEEVPATIAILRDKFNATADRMTAAQKNVFDTSEDLIKLTAIHIKHASPDMIKELEEASSLSGTYADRKFNTRKQ